MSNPTLYQFRAKSAISFRVINRGREMYVTFSQCFRGSSTYFTSDAGLADIIRRHRWFREGRITEVQDADETTSANADETASATDTTSSAAASPARARYLTSGMRFSMPAAAHATSAANAAPSVAEASSPAADSAGSSSAAADTAANESTPASAASPGAGASSTAADDSAADDSAAATSDDAADDTLSLTADEVSSFLEAKEYITSRYGVDRSSLRSKQDLAEFCAAQGIVFPNYPFDV